MIIVLNNKTYLNRDSFIKYYNELKNINTKHQLILSPSCININNTDDSIILSSQDVSIYDKSNTTGEVNATQLKSYNIKYSIIAHSERRNYFNEDINIFKKKIDNLLKHNIIPIYCLGENNKYKFKEEIEEDIKLLNEYYKDDNIIIAYEPVFSIGTGILLSNKEIEENIAYIKRNIINKKVIYGGSVNEKNIDILKNIKNIDGFLLGKVSIKIDKLKELLEKI